MPDSYSPADAGFAVHPRVVSPSEAGLLPIADASEGRSPTLRPSDDRVQTLAVAIDLLTRVEACGSLSQAADQVVHSLRQHLQADEVLILWRKPNQRTLILLAGHHQHDDRLPSQESDRFLVAAAEEVMARSGMTQWPPPGFRETSPNTTRSNDSSALMAISQWARIASVKQMAGVTLTDLGGDARGVLLIVDPQHAATGLLPVLGVSLGAKLAGLERREPTAMESRLRELKALWDDRRRAIVLVLAAACVACMLLPLRYRISVDLEMRPVAQRFVAVPFDGPLKETHVRPGDVVQQGDLLATINPREIEYELAGVRAELSRAMQERKGLLAEHDFAGSQLAELESDKLRHQADLLEYQRNHLEIRSPIAGVVITGDLEPSEGMPLTRGETLFEIALLGQWVVEMAVPESDFDEIRVGMPVVFHVHAFPDQRLHGTVERIHPRAELRDHQNVFVAELRISDPQRRLRPGMRGRARIIGDRHTLAWNLFHKAYYALRRNLGW